MSNTEDHEQSDLPAKKRKFDLNPSEAMEELPVHVVMELEDAEQAGDEMSGVVEENVVNDEEEDGDYDADHEAEEEEEEEEEKMKKKLADLKVKMGIMRNLKGTVKVVVVEDDDDNDSDDDDDDNGGSGGDDGDDYDYVDSDDHEDDDDIDDDLWLDDDSDLEDLLSRLTLDKTWKSGGGEGRGGARKGVVIADEPMDEGTN